MTVPTSQTKAVPKYTFRDFASDQEVRWCPGCGDYAILKQVQMVLPQLGIPKEKFVFISGIGCSSRFPYYMNLYGLHGIHGRATAIASGVKMANPDLNVWIISGDGDALSIGGNHTLHLIRRNLDVNLLVFNNEIYGLTKGQYSPTSPKGTKNKTAPLGTIDQPFNPLILAMAADGTFIARSTDRDPALLKEILLSAAQHKGTSFIEIYQNCNVFNDGAFSVFTDKSTREDFWLVLKNGDPLVFGEAKDKGIVLNGTSPEIVSLNDDYSRDDLWIHDESDPFKAAILCRFFDDPRIEGGLPRPFGIFYKKQAPTYERELMAQIQYARDAEPADLQTLLKGDTTWTVE